MPFFRSTGARDSRTKLGGARRFLRGFLRENHANVAMTLGVTLLPLMGAVGLATDSALALMVRNQMSDALDTAGLAAGRVIFTEDVSVDAQSYFEANFEPGFMDSTVTEFSVSVDENQEFVTLEASATVPTRFMKLWGHEELTVHARTVIHRANRGMELALVMDNTGSMRSGNKMNAMKDAAQELIDNIYGDEESHDNLWVSLVPYTATVNVGADRTNWLAPDDQVFDDPDPFAPSAWLGCVEARAFPLDRTDTPPGAEPFNSFLYETDVDNVWPPLKEANSFQNDGTGPNLGCGPEITPLTQSKTVIKDAIAEMLPWHRGGTTSNLGLVWGWRAISPQWQGLWGGSTPANMPFEYNTEDMDKVVVLLTDGQNQFYDWPNHGPTGAGPAGSDYTAYGRLEEFGFATLGDAREEIDERFAVICEAMKDEGIILFTITFGPSPNSSTQELYRNCATTPSQYFHSPSNSDLEETFHKIAHELSNLRIAE